MEKRFNLVDVEKNGTMKPHCKKRASMQPIIFLAEIGLLNYPRPPRWQNEQLWPRSSRRACPPRMKRTLPGAAVDMEKQHFLWKHCVAHLKMLGEHFPQERWVVSLD